MFDNYFTFKSGFYNDIGFVVAYYMFELENIPLVLKYILLRTQNKFEMGSGAPFTNVV